jgi:hypothetical protein
LRFATHRRPTKRLRQCPMSPIGPIRDITQALLNAERRTVNGEPSRRMKATVDGESEAV